jgi:hypothetical protein
MRPLILLLLLGACAPQSDNLLKQLPPCACAPMQPFIGAVPVNSDQELLRELRWQQRLHELEERREWRRKHLWKED